MTLEEIIRSLLKHWKLIVAGAVITGVVALGFSLMQTPTYQTSADLTSAKTAVNISFESKIKTLSQEEIAKAVSGESRMQALLGLVKNGTIANNVYDQLKDELPERFESPRNLVGMVSAESQGDLIRISVSGSDPELISKVANAWARTYERQINEIYGTTTTEETGQIVTDAMKGAKKDYEQAQTKVEDFLANNQISEIKREIENKQAIIKSLQNGKKKAVETLIDTELEARSKIISAYINAHADNLLKAFQEEQEVKKKLLTEYFNAELENRLMAFKKDREQRVKLFNQYVNNQIENKMMALNKDRKLREEMFNKVANEAINNRLLALEKDFELNQKLFNEYVNAEIKAKTTTISQEVQDRLNRLSGEYSNRRTLTNILNDAKTMRQQIKSGRNTTSSSNDLALLFLKAKAYNSGGKMPTNLEFSFQSPKDLSGGPQAHLEELDSLITSLRERLDELDNSIDKQSKQLMKNEGYQFLGIEDGGKTELTQQILEKYNDLFQIGKLGELVPGKDTELSQEIEKKYRDLFNFSEFEGIEPESSTELSKKIEQKYNDLFQFGKLEELGQKSYIKTPLLQAVQKKYPELFKVGDIAQLSESVSKSNPLAQQAMEASRKLLQLKGLEDITSYTATTEPITQEINRLENRIDELRSKLEQQQARKKELERERELAWNEYDTLAAKASEVDVASAIKGTEVKLASQALPPTNPVSPQKKRNTLLGGFAGLIAAMGLALVIEHPAVKSILEEKEEDAPEEEEDESKEGERE